MTQSTHRWTVDCTPPLGHHQWGSAHFVFHPASGQTHYLNQACAEIIAFLVEEPVGVEAIFQRLSEHHTNDDEPELREAIGRVIALLEQLGVISSQP